MKNIFKHIGLLVMFLIVAPTLFAQTYCNPTFANGCSLWNNSAITLSTLNWTAPSSCTTWDFSTTQIPMTAGVATAMTVTNGQYCGCAVWVDLNNDGDMLDAGENLYSNYASSSSTVYSFNITLPAATPNGLYRMRVIGPWGSDGISSTNGSGPCGAYQYGNHQDFTLNVGGITPCIPPSGITSTAISTSSATVSWGAVAGAAGYEYLVNTTYTAPTVGTSTTAISYNATALLPATKYYVHLRTKCSNTSYSVWKIDSFTTTINCVQPTGLNVASITNSSASLSWMATVGATGYEYAVNTIATPPATGTFTTATTYNASALSMSTAYYLHVRSVCGTSTFSNWATYAFSTLPNCITPTNFQVTNLTSSGADISWTGGTGVVNYEYVLDNSPLQPSGLGTGITPPGYSASGLTSNTLYYMHVRSVCGSAVFSAWDSVSFKTNFVSSVNNFYSAQLLLSPNPTNDFVTIVANTSSLKSEVHLISMDGKILKSFSSNNSKYKIDLKGYPAGLYFVKYFSGKEQGVAKIVKVD